MSKFEEKVDLEALAEQIDAHRIERVSDNLKELLSQTTEGRKFIESVETQVAAKTAKKERKKEFKSLENKLKSP